MTKLLEWLSAFIALFSVWYLLISKKVARDFVSENETLIFYSPIIAILLFGMYAASVVFYRVFTFNDCEEAAKELHKEIREAREDLRIKGFNFKNSDK
ncbi:dolichol-phosphate mannosyltransferase subunit 3 [Holotrichia oblita]|uniref:Dolichol-phosphate mannosyltransferase subunit 3 n=1 Tax=Holotrichia oblita TaxID=644536 RepID=A0ACB9SMN1_HOLOL|nr:dolichol-phosphate mannosyltransferase subunit 3 [Holotrichia oblita]